MVRWCIWLEYSPGFLQFPSKPSSERALVFRLFFPARMRRSLGEFTDTAKTAVSVFPFQSQKTSLCTSSSEEHVCPYMLSVFSITSPPIPLLPFSSSSSAASSSLFLLMMDFQNSWYYMLKIPMKIRYRKVPGSVISLVLSNVLITEAFSYPFTIIFTYLFMYAFGFFFLVVCFAKHLTVFT